jgi:hypothetical protein
MNPLFEGLMYVLSTVGALLPIVNPLSAVGLVMSITSDLTDQERREDAEHVDAGAPDLIRALLLGQIGGDAHHQADCRQRIHDRQQRADGAEDVHQAFASRAA